ncbi:MAG: metalloregulator ArsR/SmtB family transcription factor [Thermoanaerobaculia bacterium]
MNTSSDKEHESRPADCADKLKALADVTRLAAMEALMDGPLHVGELATRLRVEQSLLSHHLRVLREMGLLEATRDGKAVLYALAPGVEGTDRTLQLGCCRLSFEENADV